MLDRSSSIALVSLLLLAACGGAARPSVRPAPPPPPAAIVPDETRAWEAYEAKRHGECARMFLAIAEQLSGRAKNDPLYNAACCHALDGKPDAALALLESVTISTERGLSHMKQDPDLASLHGDPRWSRIVAANEARIAAQLAALLEPALRRELLALAEEDQRARGAAMASPPDEATRAAVMAIDRKTTARMKEIVGKHGFPGRTLIGDDGVAAAFLLIQHADQDPAFQKECLARMEPLVKSGEVAAHHHAYLFDRVALAEGRPQRYGTQFDASGEPAPIEDEANVDKRRAAAGLSSMAEYRKLMEQAYGAPKK